MKPRTIARFVIPASALIACQDVYSTDLDIPSGGTTSAIDAGGSTTTSTGLLTPQPPPTCPNVIKTFGDGGAIIPPQTDDGRCELSGAVCEYGTSPDRNCNEVYTCPSESEAWRQLPGERCASFDECPKNQPISAIEGLPCGFDGGVSDADELHCNMSDGVCACTTGRGGTDVHPRQWVCTKPLSACPLVRPNQGQPCQGGMVCDYGSCRSKRGMAMTCIRGVWGATSIDCTL